MKTQPPPHRNPLRLIGCIMATFTLAAMSATAKEAPIDPASLRLAGDVPVIGAWFPQDQEMKDPEGFKDFLDAAARHSTYTLLTTTMRNGHLQMTEPYTHDWFKRAAAYAKERGIGIALELDVRHSWKDYHAKYPEAKQQRLMLESFDPGHESRVVKLTYLHNHLDAIMRPPATDIRMERVYSYIPSPSGARSVTDITASCKVMEVGKVMSGKLEGRSISVELPAAVQAGGKVVVITRVTLLSPDVFSPELLAFEADTFRQYADVPLAGALKDEWGFPADHKGNPHKNNFWTSRHREADYAERTNGRDLIRDSILMWIGEEGRESERQAAINHYMEQSRERNSEIENTFYTLTKETFGSDAFVGTHDTVFPYPDAREYERNGLNWWTATRDFAQSDETTPYSTRTSMAKKFGGSVWYNQWWSGDLATYKKEIWRYALTGGRMNFHIIFPVPGNDYKEGGKILLRSSLLRGDSRIRLLNLISDAPLDCPVAVIFGHANAMNWAGNSFEDVGTVITDAFWRVGIYADLIPSSEIGNGSLRVDEKGDVWYGKQRYAAVVLYQPEFENFSTAEFFQKAAGGDSLLYRMGVWTKDFNAKPLDSRALLPARMKLAKDADSCASEIIAKLKHKGIEPQTPSSGEFPKWQGMGETSINMPAAGRSRLTDGTVILVAGEKDPMGDPIQQTLKVNGQDVTFDALGIAAVRLSEDGKLEAMAAGGLKHFKAGSVEIRLGQPADIALWRDAQGAMQGVLQGYNGDLPASLKAITANWQRVSVPTQLDPPEPPSPPSAKSSTDSSQFDAN